MVNQSEVALLQVQVREARLQLEAARAREIDHLKTIGNLQQTLGPQGISTLESALNAKLAQLNREKESYRVSKQNADLSVLELRMALKDANQRLEAIQERPLYIAVEAIASSTSSWKHFSRLPLRLFSVWQRWRTMQRAQQAPLAQPIASKSASDYAKASDTALSMANDAGLDAALKWLKDQHFKNSLTARILVGLARHVRSTSPADAVTLAKQALELDPSEGRTKVLAFTMMDAGAHLEAADLLRAAIAGGSTFNATEQRRTDELFALERLHGQGNDVPVRRYSLAHRPAPRKPHLLIFAAQSMPFHRSANALRVHGAAQAAEAAGWKTVVVTPPGYPAVAGGDVSNTGPESVYGITYYRLPAVSVLPSIVDTYASQVAPLLARVANEFECSIIQAPADLALLYPALTAARTTGLLLAVDFDRSPKADAATSSLNLRDVLETKMIGHADGVIARNIELAHCLELRGIPSDRIRILPDVAPEIQGNIAKPNWRDEPALANRMIIGLFGDPDDHLDAEMLPSLLDKLVASGHDVGLAIFGAGARFQKIKAQAEALGHGTRILLSGRPRAETISHAYKCIDLVVVPISRNTPSVRAYFAIVDAQRHGRPLLIVGTAGSEAMSKSGMIIAEDLDSATKAVARFCAQRRPGEEPPNTSSEDSIEFFTPKSRAEDLALFYRSLTKQPVV